MLSIKNSLLDDVIFGTMIYFLITVDIILARVMGLYMYLGMSDDVVSLYFLFCSQGFIQSGTEL